MTDRNGKIRGVLFDAGNTLVRVRTSVGDVYATVARRYGAEARGDVLERRFRQVFEAQKGGFVGSVSRPHSPEKEKAWWKGLVEEMFRAADLWGSIAPAFDEYFEELYAAFERPDHWELFPDVLPCLDALDDLGVPMAVVSNWDSRLHAVLEGLGVRRRFRFVLTSAEFGAEKPHVSIFISAAARLGLPPWLVLHVGDLYSDDVVGPERAGLQAALVDRDERNHRGHRVARDLREVAQWVRDGCLPLGP